MHEVNVSNNGIDIATSKGALARAVFDGEVTGVANIPGSGKVVIVRHGEYLSVYANLDEVYIKPGEKESKASESVCSGALRATVAYRKVVAPGAVLSAEQPQRPRGKAD